MPLTLLLPLPLGLLGFVGSLCFLDLIGRHLCTWDGISRVICVWGPLVTDLNNFDLVTKTCDTFPSNDDPLQVPIMRGSGKVFLFCLPQMNCIRYNSCIVHISVKANMQKIIQNALMATVNLFRSIIMHYHIIWDGRTHTPLHQWRLVNFLGGRSWATRFK